jgi:hypothetical protein
VRTVESERLVLTALPTHIHLALLAQLKEMRVQLSNGPTQVLLMESVACHLYQDGFHPIINHLLEQFLLLSVPEIGQRGQPVPLASDSHKKYMFSTRSF